jgi:uncharacterized membrane protein YphA (DoxX/SURF4 family)
LRSFAAHPAHTWVGVPIRALIGIVFIYASWYKLAVPHDFAISIAMYDMVPLAVINVMAITLPAVELAAGVSLLLGLWTRASALVINAMLVVFIVAIGYIVYFRGMADFGCGCFSPAAEEAGKELATGTLWRDFGYLMGGLYVMAFDDGTIGLDGILRRFGTRSANEVD